MVTFSRVGYTQTCIERCRARHGPLGRDKLCFDIQDAVCEVEGVHVACVVAGLTDAELRTRVVELHISVLPAVMRLP